MIDDLSAGRRGGPAGSVRSRCSEQHGETHTYGHERALDAATSPAFPTFPCVDAFRIDPSRAGEARI